MIRQTKDAPHCCIEHHAVNCEYCECIVITHLYAVAVEFFNRRTGRVRTEITHVHAVDESHARFIYRQGDVKGRIVACGQVIGYFADENGERLSA